MKKILFLMLASFTLFSCSVDDDNVQNVTYEVAWISDHNLPASFTLGENFNVEVTYTLPTGCSVYRGLDAVREGTTDELRRNIYVAAVSQKLQSPNCDETVEGGEGTGNFSILINEREDYTFYFLTGESASGQPQYQEVVVPVADTDLTP